MKALSLTVFLVGFFGFFWTLFGSMVVSYAAVFLNFFKASKAEDPSTALPPVSHPIHFEVLIAAYNEEKMIGHTLGAVKKCALALQKLEANPIQLSVRVGLDHCTDQTLSIVETFSKTTSYSIEAVENNGPRGKWFVLQGLIRSSKADWVALTDCGAVWNENLLIQALPSLEKKEVVCISPSYLPANAGFLETLYWRYEQCLRKAENLSGGPTIVHGPTVFYKREALLKAINLLGNQHWINDDVAIPLTLRLSSEKNEIVYLATFAEKAWVVDEGVVAAVDIEYRRRKRILIGNLQWFREIYLPRFTFNSVVCLMSSRRAFKIFWAYWALLFGVGTLGMAFTWINLGELLQRQPTAVVIGEIGLISGFIVHCIRSNWIHRFSVAFLSGLRIANSWKALNNPKTIVWS